MALIRTFIGLKASERVTRNVARVVSRLENTGANYRWVSEENLHVTLNFVGDLPDIETHQFCRDVARTLEKFSGFDLSLHGVDAFPQANQPRTIWIGVEQGQEELQQLNQALAELLYEWGVNKDRNEYVPHMTLGRLGRGGRWNQELLELMHRLRNHDGGHCFVDQVVVYSSFLDKRGPTYTPMSTIRL